MNLFKLFKDTALTVAMSSFLGTGALWVLGRLEPPILEAHQRVVFFVGVILFGLVFRWFQWIKAN